MSLQQDEIAECFAEIFDKPPKIITFAPGRVNLLGEHIDMHGGHVLPMALPFGISLAAAPINGANDKIASRQFEGVTEHSCGDGKTDHWSDYIAGALEVARSQKWLQGAAAIYCNSAIPVGAGLSSSAATIIATLKAFAPDGFPATDLALLAQSVEHDFIGVPCGIMDQMAIAAPSPGEILLLDCRSLSHEKLALPQNCDIAVVHSGQRRALADGRYSERVREAKAAQKKLNIPFLTDLAKQDTLPELEDSTLTSRVRHIVSEEQRVMRAIEAIRTGDAKTFGALMHRGHRSMADDFEASTPEIDTLVTDAEHYGAYGARITGAGFGGCIVALLPEGEKQSWWQQLGKNHPSASLLY
ncbi:MAG: galactokinase [Pseudomonadota bacterium]